MYSVFTPTRGSHSRTAVAVNSAPLSERIWSGGPCSRTDRSTDPARRQRADAGPAKGGATAFDYTYDMGDNWEHRIIIERVETAETGKLLPDFQASIFPPPFSGAAMESRKS
jgi:hypothetical protein